MALTAGAAVGIFILLFFNSLFPPSADNKHKQIWANEAHATCATHGGLGGYSIGTAYDTFFCNDGAGPYYFDYEGNLVVPQGR